MAVVGAAQLHNMPSELFHPSHFLCNNHHHRIRTRSCCCNHHRIHHFYNPCPRKPPCTAFCWNHSGPGTCIPSRTAYLPYSPYSSQSISSSLHRHTRSQSCCFRRRNCHRPSNRRWHILVSVSLVPCNWDPCIRTGVTEVAISRCSSGVVRIVCK